MGARWGITDVCGDTTIIAADPEYKEVRVTQTVSDDDEDGDETTMCYTLEQLDTLIAALTEARRAIS